VALAFVRKKTRSFFLSLVVAMAVTDVTSPLAGAASPCKAPHWNDPDKDPPTFLLYKTFFSASAGAEVSYLVYLPPSYGFGRRYPVIYWLHGLLQNSEAGADFVKMADKRMRARLMPEAIIVLPRGLESMWINSHPAARYRVPMERVLFEFVAKVDSSYATIPRREKRAIEGFSMGGYGSFNLGFSNPEVFGVVSNLAGAILDYEGLPPSIQQCVYAFDRDYLSAQHPATLVRTNAETIRGRTAIRIIIGNLDNIHRLVDLNRKMSGILDELGIAHGFRVVPGVGHCYQCLYRAVGDPMWRFWGVLGR